jgi:acylphosphatase
VGFRYTAERIAGGYVVAGYVRNLPDGRVLLVAEGEREEVEGLLDQVRREVGGIRDVSVDRSSADGEFGCPAAGALRIRY